MSLASKQTEVKYLKTGKRGMLPYPAGEWAADVTYTATDNVAPYVLRNGTYYVMNKVGSVKGLDPQADYATGGQQATWIPLEDYKAVYVELLMARLGLIGKSVFWDDYTFSQEGVDAGGQPSSDYQGFADGSFTPNILIDWVKGTIRLLKLVAEGADVSGTIKAISGEIGQFLIDRSGLSRTQGDNEIRLNPNEIFLKRVVKYMVSELARVEIQLGKESGQSNTDAEAITAATIYRRILNYMEENRYVPAMRIISDNSSGYNVGLRVEGGGIVAEQGVLACVATLSIRSGTPNTIRVDQGSDWMVWTESGQNALYLPHRDELCAAFGKNWQTDWVCARFRITSNPFSEQHFKIYFPSDDQGTFYNQNGNTMSNPELGPGDSIEFYLQSEPSNYWFAQTAWSK